MRNSKIYLTVTVEGDRGLNILISLEHETYYLD